MNDTIMLKEIMEQVQNIEDCHNYNTKSMKDIADAILAFKPQNIVIVGRGTSIHAGIYARYLFERYYHLPVSIASQSIFTVYNSYTDMSKSLVIGISQSGSGNDTLAVLKKAKEDGALTIGVVNNLESDIAHAVDHVLYCDAGEAKALPATKTFTTTLYLLTSLVFALTNEESLKVEKEGIKNAISRGFGYQEVLKEKVGLFKEAESIFVLGRGLTLPLAMETALKIKETSHIHVGSYPIAEFYHGPIAMINKNIPTIVLGIEKELKNDVIQILDRLKEKEVPTLVITNDEEIMAKSNNYVYIESSKVIESFFTATVIIQLLACELAILKGFNPDSDPSLIHIKTF
jgi:glucosamine--fructose-6-phosphate aminotransferase (isomerizing)